MGDVKVQSHNASIIYNGILIIQSITACQFLLNAKFTRKSFNFEFGTDMLC